MDTIATLTVFLVASVRLLPSLNAIFQNFNIINLEMDSVQKLYVELSQNMNLLEASERAVNKDINFNYKNFKNLNLSNSNFHMVIKE